MAFLIRALTNAFSSKADPPSKSSVAAESREGRPGSAAGAAASGRSKNLTLRFLVLGSRGCGKTSIIQRYVGQLPSETYTPTIGPELFLSKQLSAHTTKYELRVRVLFTELPFDEIQGTHVPTLLPQMDGVILVFDSTSRRSILAVDAWRAALTKCAPAPDLPILVLANKADADSPVISLPDLMQYGRESGSIACRACSARTGADVRPAIDELVSVAVVRSRRLRHAARRTAAAAAGAGEALAVARLRLSRGVATGALRSEAAGSNLPAASADTGSAAAPAAAAPPAGSAPPLAAVAAPAAERVQVPGAADGGDAAAEGAPVPLLTLAAHGEDVTRLYDALDRDLGALRGVVDASRRPDIALLLEQSETERATHLGRMGRASSLPADEMQAELALLQSQLLLAAQRWEGVARELLTELAAAHPYATLTASVRNTYTSLLRRPDGTATDSSGDARETASARSLSSLSSLSSRLGSLHSLPGSAPGSASGSTPVAGLRAVLPPPLQKVRVPHV